MTVESVEANEQNNHKLTVLENFELYFHFVIVFITIFLTIYFECIQLLKENNDIYTLNSDESFLQLINIAPLLSALYISLFYKKDVFIYIVKLFRTNWRDLYMEISFLYRKTEKLYRIIFLIISIIFCLALTFMLYNYYKNYLPIEIPDSYYEKYSFKDKINNKKIIQKYIRLKYIENNLVSIYSNDLVGLKIGTLQFDSHVREKFSRIYYAPCPNSIETEHKIIDFNELLASNRNDLYASIFSAIKYHCKNNCNENINDTLFELFSDNCEAESERIGLVNRRLNGFVSDSMKLILSIINSSTNGHEFRINPAIDLADTFNYREINTIQSKFGPITESEFVNIIKNIIKDGASTNYKNGIPFTTIRGSSPQLSFIQLYKL